MPGRKRRRGGQRPLWGTMPVDVEISKVYPVEGWVMLQEIFGNKEHRVPGTDVTLAIFRPYESNTVYGKILAIHPETASELGAGVGDVVVYREYAGGRWSFNGIKALLTPMKDILAKVAAGSHL